MGQAQNLAMERDGPEQPVNMWDGTWDGTITISLSRFGMGRGTGQANTIFFSMISCFGTSFPVLECLFSVRTSFACFKTTFSCFFWVGGGGWGKSDFVPGHHGTEKFVPSLGNASNYPNVPQVPTALYYVALKLIIVNRDTLKCHTELGLQCFLIRNSATYKKTTLEIL